MTFPMDPLASIGGVATDRKEATTRIKQWARSEWGLDDDANVFVAELACGESDCPDKETVIAAFLQGERREIRISSPIQDITKDEISAAAHG